MRRASFVVLCVALALGFTFSTSSVAGDEKEPAAKTKAKAAKKKASASKKAKAHLDFKKTYVAALREARIRNLPIFASRHKDF